jgi:hypothetical protein
LNRVLRKNADANIRFGDLRALLIHLGFTDRAPGDLHIFSRKGIAEILNLQPRVGKAKAYQVKQVRGVITANRLVEQEEEEASQPAEPPSVERGPTKPEESNG